MAIPTYMHRNPLIPWLFHRRYTRIAELLDVPVGGRVLEFGCGIGAFLPSLNSAGLHVYAADLTLDYARTLDQRLTLGVKFIESVSSLENGCLDAIVAADVLEHVDDLPELVMEMGRKLTSGGCLVVSSPTENLVYRIGRVMAGFAGKGDYHHENAQSVEEVIMSTGVFTPVESRTLPWRTPPHLFRIVRFRYDG